MARPRLRNEIQEAVETISAENQEVNASTVVTLLHEHPRYREVRKTLQKYANPKGRFVEQRKIQEIIGNVKRRRRDQFQPVDWEPWLKEYGPGVIDRLFKSQSFAALFWGRRLYQHEADWIERLPIKSLSHRPGYIPVAMSLVSIYSKRTILGKLLERSPSYDDLDGIFTISPWEHSWSAYDEAVRENIVQAIPHVIKVDNESGDFQYILGTDALLLEFVGSQINPGRTRYADGVTVLKKSELEMICNYNKNSADLFALEIQTKKEIIERFTRGLGNLE